jgi:hypothetical protein
LWGTFYYICYTFNTIFYHLISIVTDIFLNHFIFLKKFRSIKEDCKMCLVWQSLLCRTVRYFYYIWYTFSTIFYHLISLVSDIFLNHFILSKVFRWLHRLSGDVELLKIRILCLPSVIIRRWLKSSIATMKKLMSCLSFLWAFGRTRARQVPNSPKFKELATFILAICCALQFLLKFLVMCTITF